MHENRIAHLIDQLRATVARYPDRGRYADLYDAAVLFAAAPSLSNLTILAEAIEPLNPGQERYDLRAIVRDLEELLTALLPVPAGEGGAGEGGAQ